MRRLIKIPHIVSVLAIGSFAFTILTGNNQPLFTSLDTFVLFAEKEIKLEKDVQVSSGDLGSNRQLDAQKDAIINGNLFANKITLDKNTQINGNVSFSQLKTEKNVQILGIQTKPVRLPIANLPQIPNFQIGTQDFKFEGAANTLAGGSYRNIVLEKNSRLTLTGGIYNLRKLELKENSTLIFNTPGIINIQFKFRGKDKVSILPGQNNLKPDDLKINYLGIKPKEDKHEKEDDDDEINFEFDDDKEKQDHKDRKIGRPVVFGKNSFLNFKLLAPKASVRVGASTMLRGQIVGRKIKVGSGGVISREITVVKVVKPEDIITDPNGGVYPVNEILINLVPSSTFQDAVNISSVVNGRVVGVVSSINLYQVEVPVNTISGIESALTTLQNLLDPKIEGVFRNFLVPTG